MAQLQNYSAPDAVEKCSSAQAGSYLIKRAPELVNITKDAPS